MFRFHITLCATCLLLLALPVVGDAALLSKVAAVVNEQVITTTDLDREVAPLLKGLSAQGRTPGKKELKALRSQALESLIERALLEQKASELNISVSDQDVEAAIDDIQAQNKMTRAQLVEALAHQGLDFEAYRQGLSQQILHLRLVSVEVQRKVEVTNFEVRSYYQEHGDDYRLKPFVRLSRLSFLIPSRGSLSQAEAVREKAEGALKRLRTGESFYGVLLGFSGEEGVDGGDMGSFTEGELASAFAKAIVDVPEEGVSDLVATSEGFHILRVEERGLGRIRPLEEVEGEIRDLLLEKKKKETFEQWKKDLREQAYIDIRL